MNNLPVIDLRREPWMKQGLCYDTPWPDAWFDKGVDTHPSHARLLCAGCPVTSECLTYALDNGERYGVWAGTTREQRRKMLRRRARAKA